MFNTQLKPAGVGGAQALVMWILVQALGEEVGLVDGLDVGVEEGFVLGVEVGTRLGMAEVGDDVKYFCIFRIEGLLDKSKN